MFHLPYPTLPNPTLDVHRQEFTVLKGITDIDVRFISACWLVTKHPIFLPEADWVHGLPTGHLSVFGRRQGTDAGLGVAVFGFSFGLCIGRGYGGETNAIAARPEKKKRCRDMMSCYHKIDTVSPGAVNSK